MGQLSTAPRGKIGSVTHDAGADRGVNGRGGPRRDGTGRGTSPPPPRQRARVSVWGGMVGGSALCGASGLGMKAVVAAPEFSSDAFRAILCRRLVGGGTGAACAVWRPAAARIAHLSGACTSYSVLAGCVVGCGWARGRAEGGVPPCRSFAGGGWQLRQRLRWPPVLAFVTHVCSAGRSSAERVSNGRQECSWCSGSSFYGPQSGDSTLTSK